MKKIVQLLVVLLLFSCEEVIDVELPTSDPRLAVDAIIGYNENDGNPITLGQVVLTLTAPFLNAEIPSAIGATVNIINESTGEVFQLSEIEPGVFRDGFPNLEFNIDYTLEIIYEDEIYRATEQLIPTGEITNVEQGDGFIFDEENETEIIVSFDDIPNQRNFYLFAFGFDNYLVTDDEFYADGGLTFSYFYEDIEANDLLSITLFGIDQKFASYLDQALVQSGENGGGPFQVPTSAVRGNIVNTTNNGNFPFGYFSISEFDIEVITIE